MSAAESRIVSGRLDPGMAIVESYMLRIAGRTVRGIGVAPDSSCGELLGRLPARLAAQVRRPADSRRIRSFRPLPARNAASFIAGIISDSPVLGLRPCRAARLRV